MRQARWAGLLDRFQNPTQVIATGFGAAALLGTVLLALPIATTSGEPAYWLTALFTATSAVSLTGLTVVDTERHWSLFGELVIMMLMQIGGLGIMTLATLFTVLVSGRIGLRARLFAAAETKALSAGDVRRVVRNVALFSLVVEAAVGAVLTVRFMTGYGEPFLRAVYHGAFHGVSAFNNAGFVLWPDNLARFVTDAWVCLPIAFASIVGGLGFPVVFELLRSWRHPRRWSLVTRLTLWVSAVLLALGMFVLTVTEWANPRTLGALDDPGKILAGFFMAVMPRSAGFAAIDVAEMNPSSWLAIDALMFIGGGSASTAGGIKVTTLGMLVFIIWAEMRGEPRVNIGNRRLPEPAQRQAVALVMTLATLIAVSTYLLLVLTPHSLDQVLFEVVSAAATVGLSTGITADIPAAGQVLLALLMFVGRTGPLTLGSALALRERARLYELPEERVIVG
ncbi:potassium transporter Trk [Thermopolyspora flexuosa]|uniref:Potassium uptake TrkH family protein n=1 Tax=Thermopolyspora flexuosa TaxID=103836 RepID=A0A543IWF3_9ACTN|nr:potassium transporter TrkG [Thermopolyspora flexuosa]TQM74900.1 potassium uptake TrkH family protein [Thermopolyspora flexuosa]GGM79788.1 potassium transporter Trk [Thermopolyspora flexuosa]